MSKQHNHHVQEWTRARVRVLALMEEYAILVSRREAREAGHYRNPTVAWRVGVREDGHVDYRDVMMDPVEPGVMLA